MTNLEIELKLWGIAASSFASMTENERAKYREDSTVDPNEPPELLTFRAIEEIVVMLANRLGAEYSELRDFAKKYSR